MSTNSNIPIGGLKVSQILAGEMRSHGSKNGIRTRVPSFADSYLTTRTSCYATTSIHGETQTLTPDKGNQGLNLACLSIPPHELVYCVRKERIELSRFSAQLFKSCVATSYTIPECVLYFFTPFPPHNFQTGKDGNSVEPSGFAPASSQVANPSAYLLHDPINGPLSDTVICHDLRCRCVRFISMAELLGGE